MPSQYTPSLEIQLMGIGEDSNTWGTITNANWQYMEYAVAGIINIVMSNANRTLNTSNGSSNESRYMVLNVTGSNSAIYQVIAPLQSKFYIISNNTSGGYAIQIAAAGGSTVVTIPNGVTAQVYCDGSTGFYSAQTGSAGNFTVNGTLTASGVTDTGALSAASVTVSGTLGVTGATSLTTGSISGIMTAPTATPGTSTTQIATTAFALANGIPSGAIVMWSGSIASIPSGWYLCNGSNGTPNLQDQFVVGAGSTYAVAATGGTADAIVVSHTHTATSVDAGHTHGFTASVSNSSTPTGPAGAGAPPASGTTATGNANITTTINATGSSGTGQNLPPYYALAYIMKA
jgi:hypothetical protein